MLIAVETPEHLPEWLYPYRVKPLSGATLHSPPKGGWDLGLIWKAMSAEPYPSGGMVSTNCECGFPHDAPSAVSLLAPTLVASLAELPAEKRWQVARGWATAKLKRKPNDEQLAEYKLWLRQLSEFAKQAIENGWIIVDADYMLP